MLYKIRIPKGASCRTKAGRRGNLLWQYLFRPRRHRQYLCTSTTLLLLRHRQTDMDNTCVCPRFCFYVIDRQTDRPRAVPALCSRHEYLRHGAERAPSFLPDRQACWLPVVHPPNDASLSREATSATSVSRKPRTGISVRCGSAKVVLKNFGDLSTITKLLIRVVLKAQLKCTVTTKTPSQKPPPDSVAFLVLLSWWRNRIRDFWK